MADNLSHEKQIELPQLNPVEAAAAPEEQAVFVEIKDETPEERVARLQKEEEAAHAAALATAVTFRELFRFADRYGSHNSIAHFENTATSKTAEHSCMIIILMDTTHLTLLFSLLGST
jgi:hypothetical protein